MKERLKLMPNKDERTHLEVTVDYAKGGGNVFTGQVDGRGYWVYVKPIALRADGIMSFIMFQGTKRLLEPAARLNQKKLIQVCDEARRQLASRSGPVWETVQKVLADYNLALLEAVAVAS